MDSKVISSKPTSASILSGGCKSSGFNTRRASSFNRWRSRSMLSGAMLKPAAIAWPPWRSSRSPHSRNAAARSKPGDAPARTAHLAVLAADDDGRPVKFLKHARRHDTHDADMPEQLPLDDDEIRLRVEFGAHRAGRLPPRCHARFSAARDSANPGFAPAAPLRPESLASNKCKASSAVSSRPAAFRRGAS